MLTKIIKSSEILFKCIKEKVLKGYMIDATEWLVNQKELIDKVIDDNKLTPQELKRYMESVNGCLYSLENLCIEEYIVNKKFLKLIEELTTKVNSYL